jgi:hypothetical protein
MARHLSFKIIGNEKNWFKLHSSDASKTWWNNQEPDLNFTTITEDQFTKIKHAHSFFINASNQVEIDPIPDGTNIVNGLNEVHVNSSITEAEAKKGLDEHIAAMENHLTNNISPLWTQADVDALKAIDISGISWPVETTFKSWVAALENNSILIDHILEV